MRSHWQELFLFIKVLLSVIAAVVESEVVVVVEAVSALVAAGCLFMLAKAATVANDKWRSFGLRLLFSLDRVCVSFGWGGGGGISKGVM